MVCILDSAQSTVSLSRSLEDFVIEINPTTVVPEHSVIS